MVIHLFHGACNGCTRQEIEPQGTEYCIRCQNFKPDWNLPDLNNRPPTEAEIEEARIKAKYNI